MHSAMHSLAVFTLWVAPGVALGGWVAPSRAPYISTPEITENFLEIFWRLLGCREVSGGMECGFLELS